MRQSEHSIGEPVTSGAPPRQHYLPFVARYTAHRFHELVSKTRRPNLDEVFGELWLFQ
jgi:hypothetical protein